MPEGGYYTAVKEDGRTKQQKPRRGQKTAPSVAIPTFLPFPGTEPNRPLNSKNLPTEISLKNIFKISKLISIYIAHCIVIVNESTLIMFRDIFSPCSKRYSNIILYFISRHVHSV